MRTRISMLVAVLAAVVVALAMGAGPFRNVQPTSTGSTESTALFVDVTNLRPFRFVGVTTQSFNGGAGWLAMAQACAAEFPGSRMAFADEIRNTPNPPSIAADAWVLFRPNELSSYDTSGNFVPGQASGYDCVSWTNSADNATGVRVSTTGSMHLTACYAELRAACSGPK